MTTTSYKRKAGLNATAYGYLIDALLRGPKSKAELEAITGMSPGLVGRCLKALRDRKILPVVGWRPDARGRMTIREYIVTIDRRDDEPCPRMERREIERRYEQRLRERKAQR